MALESLFLFFPTGTKNLPSCRYCALYSLVPMPFRKHFIAPRQGHITFSNQGLNYLGFFSRKIIMIYLRIFIFGKTYSFHFVNIFNIRIIYCLLSPNVFCLISYQAHKISHNHDKSSNAKRKP